MPITPTALRELKPPEEVKPPERRTLIEAYDEVKIWREPGETLPLYEVPTPRYIGEERALISTILEIATKVIPEPPPALAPHKRRDYYQARVLEIIAATPELHIPKEAHTFYTKAVVREMAGYGAIDPLIADDSLEEVMIIGPGKPIYVYHRRHGMLRTNITLHSDADIQAIIERIARSIGRRIDISSPLLDARTPDGTRVTATIPPASVDGSTMSLRKFRRIPFTITELIALNTMNAELAAFLWLAVEGLGMHPANMIIAGGTASGKTTTLNVLANFIPDRERLITIEETIELSLPLSHIIRFESRPPGLERTGEITLDMLLKNALHMRPDRIIIGEIRAEEGYTLFAAMNVGHTGVAGTLHANSAREALIRLISPPISVPVAMLSSLNLIVMQQRVYDRRKGLIRRVTEIAELTGIIGTEPQLQVLYHWEPLHDAFVSTGILSAYLAMLGRLTGLDRAAMGDELRKRAIYLQALVDKKVFDQQRVWQAIQSYYRSPTST